MTVRVRFAPSPTGMFHVGGARSALQNWIYAKQHGGVFVLRIEDTDAARNRPEWTEGILTALDWLGISRGSYEGPLLQSSYAEDHRAAALRLSESGQAYYCDCTREDVLTRVAAHSPGGRPTGYDGHCRDRGLTAGPGRALRFRTPDEGETVVVDLIRGTPTFDNKLIEDFVIARSDGSAVFLLANVVDDLTMGITHVIRAEEHLPNTPKQQLLWQALGSPPPVWAHVPVVVNEKRQKLSKRRDKVALEDYRAEGYLAEAMKNYLMLLGWAPSGDREIVPWSVIEEEFRLEQVNSSPAFFDIKKLRAFNGEYIRALPVEEFIAACQPWITGDAAAVGARGLRRQGVRGARPVGADPGRGAVGDRGERRLRLPAAARDRRGGLGEDHDRGRGRPAQRGDRGVRAGTHLGRRDAQGHRGGRRRGPGLKLGKAQAPVRVAVTGRTVGLPLFESLAVLGRERTVDRLRTALSRLD